MYDSRTIVRFDGGPKPWVLDGSKYFASMSAEDNVPLTLERHGGGDFHFPVTCHRESTSAVLRLKVGNEPTASNPIPASEMIEVC